MDDQQKKNDDIDMKKVKGGAGFLVGWLGSWYIVEEVFGSDWSSFIYVLIGLFLYAVFSGMYSEEAEEYKKARQEKEQAQQTNQGS